MELKDDCAMRGIERTITQDEFKRAYCKLARKYPPDVSKEAEAKAREALIDTESSRCSAGVASMGPKACTAAAPGAEPAAYTPRQERQLGVKPPQGVRQGQHLRLSGQGPADGQFGGKALSRTRRALRLAPDVELDLAAIGLVLDRLAENDRLRSRGCHP